MATLLSRESMFLPCNTLTIEKNGLRVLRLRKFPRLSPTIFLYELQKRSSSKTFFMADWRLILALQLQIIGAVIFVTKKHLRSFLVRVVKQGFVQKVWFFGAKKNSSFYWDTASKCIRNFTIAIIGVCGLVVEFFVAFEAARVWFPADAAAENCTSIRKILQMQNN